MYTKFLSATFIFVLLVFTATGQETIQSQFDDFYENQTNSWEDYQMIKRPRLKNFWKVVSDTLNNQKQQISENKKEVVRLNAQIKTHAQRIAELESMLGESEAFNDKISFLGMPVSKSAYNIVVWAIILGLAFGVGTIYIMFMRSNSITQKTQKMYSSLEREYDEHKNRARENQAKLKRELQTALNTLQENRINL